MQKLEYLRVMLQNLVIPDMALAADYVSLVLWNDGLRHPLFLRMPCELEDGPEPFKISQEEYEAHRLPFLECRNPVFPVCSSVCLIVHSIGIITNVAVSIEGQAGVDQSTTPDHNQYVELIASMLTTMKSVFSVRDLRFCLL